MISIEILKKNNMYFSFSCRGHAGFDEYGHDIICASVSALVINTFNSLEKFTKDPLGQVQQKEGYVSWQFNSLPLSDKSCLLMDSLLLGLRDIKESYGGEYISIQENNLQNA